MRPSPHHADRDRELGFCLFNNVAVAAEPAIRRCCAPLGAVLDGGYDPPALAESVLATAAALSGAGDAELIAPDQIVTPRAASHLGHFWEL